MGLYSWQLMGIEIHQEEMKREEQIWDIGGILVHAETLHAGNTM